MLMKFAIFTFFLLDTLTAAYTIYNIDDSHVCNKSIYLDYGHNSAAILKLTSRKSYSSVPLYCTIRFKVPLHNWSGLTGILENVDLTVFKDNSHHMGQPFCVDHITIYTGAHDPSPQCGSWSISSGQPLTKFGYNKAIFGYCPLTNFGQTQSLLNNEDCRQISELVVVVSIGKEKHENLWNNHTWKPHAGFTFVITAYNNPIKNGESECKDGLRSCSRPNAPLSILGPPQCVHDSLWCDGHINCGYFENMDEVDCFKKGLWGGLVTVVIGPWMGASIFLVLASCLVMYWRSTRSRGEGHETNQEFNSYAESYELSSNLPSAHHMAIQVRVFCNPNQRQGNPNQPWKNDLPPSYETLFPGPSTAGGSAAASSSSATTQVATNVTSGNVTASIVSTISSSLGVTVSSNVINSLDVGQSTGNRTNSNINATTNADCPRISSLRVSTSHSVTSEANDANLHPIESEEMSNIERLLSQESSPVVDNSENAHHAEELPIMTILSECGVEERDLQTHSVVES